MLSRVQRTIREHALIASGDRVLCAVSGGPDSMALLHGLWELRDRLGLAALEVATVDHGLRVEARAEAERVAERARDLGLGWHLLTVDVRTARERTASWQDVARRLRLAALVDLARAIGAQRIALGHQADDQAETVLFRILRGTGVRGLSGIPYRRERFIRPLLDIDRAQILAYLRRRSIPFVDDPSNADPRFARSRLRHQIIPALRTENPRLADALRALAADAARLGLAPGPGPMASVNRRAATVIERLQRHSGGTRQVDVAGAQAEIAYGQVTWLPPRSSPAVAVAGGITDGVVPRLSPSPLLPIVIDIDGPGDYGWVGAPPVAIREGAPVAGAASFDAEVVGRPLRLRSIRPGDRMRPRGGRGSRKLSDMLIDAKVARAARSHLPVLTTVDDEILFVPGLRPAELARPSESTRRWLSVFSLPSRAEPNRDDPETSV